MTDLIDEVVQDIKEEQHNYITRKITRIFVVCAIVAVVTTAIFAWKERTVSELQYRLGMWLNQAITLADNNKLDEAIINFDKVIEYSHQQYAAIACLNKAAILVKQHKIEEAQKLLLFVTDQPHFDDSFKDLAKVTYLGNQLNYNLTESSQTADFLDKIIKDNRPWQLSGLQLQALYALKHGKIDEAKASLNKILESKNGNKASYDTATTLLALTSRDK